MKQMKVDTKKLRKILSDKNLLIGVVSVDCGFSDSYISNVTQRGLAAKPFVDNLERLYGIKYDEYKPTEEEHKGTEEARETVEIVPEITFSQEAIDELQKVITMGVYLAVEKLLKDKII